MRIMGIDLGSHRVGIAITDELGLTAQPLTTIDISDDRSKTLVPAIAALCTKHCVDTVVIGLPLSLSGGDRGNSSRRARALGTALESRLKLNVVFFDERFTTSAANRVLVEGNVRRAQRRDVVDKVAATLILQGYLDGKPTP